MKYRPEIDGLRAIAVVPVILFHARLAQFRGGFVGVDVFFVISGYLITSIIRSDLQAGSFSIAGFYERRIRRILPALYVVLAANLPLAWLWLRPDDLRLFARSLAAVSIFASNIFFYRQSGYFAPSAEFAPLLHTWSLAVEEQFYLIFPVLLLIARRLDRRHLMRLVVLVAALSLAFTHWESQRDASAVFYLLPSRGWELLIGTYLALWSERPSVAAGSAWLAQGASAAGLVMIAGPVFLFNEHTPFQGVNVVVPTIGAALVIAFGTPQTLVGRLLGSRLLVGIGLVSYSAYLWHQPLFAYARHALAAPLTPGITVAMILLTFVAAYLSGRFVERPIRTRGLIERRLLFAGAAAVGTSFLVVGVAANAGDGFTGRYAGFELDLVSYAHYPSEALYRDGSCFLPPSDGPAAFSASCAATDRVGRSTVVWGDSHAAALAAGFREVLGSVSQYTASLCPPLLDLQIQKRPHCTAVNRFVLRRIREARPAHVYLHANWTYYDPDSVRAGLRRTLAAVRAAAPGVSVVLVGTVPLWSADLPGIVLRTRRKGDTASFLPMDRVADATRVDEILASQAKAFGFSFASPRDVLCRDGRCRVEVMREGVSELTAFDGAHLTRTGAWFLVTSLLKGR